MNSLHHTSVTKMINKKFAQLLPNAAQIVVKEFFSYKVTFSNIAQKLANIWATLVGKNIDNTLQRKPILVALVDTTIHV